MRFYIINCRSLTYAQRAERILKRAGVTAQILRTPQSLAGEGCSHGVRVPERWFQRAIAALRRAEFPILRIYAADEDGIYHEVWA